MRLTASLLLAAFSTLPAMSVSQDGRVVVFAENGKIVRWRQGLGAELLADEDRVAPIIAGTAAMFRSYTNHYWMAGPRVSANGETVFYHANLLCWSRCNIANLSNTAVGKAHYVDGSTQTFATPVSFSPNARFRRTVEQPSIGSALVRVTDVLTGEQIALGGGRDTAWSGRLVANDGTAVLGDKHVWRPGKGTVELGERIALTNDGRQAFYSRGTELRRRTWATDADEVLLTAASPIANYEINDDGSVIVLALTDGRAVLRVPGRTEVLAESGAEEVGVSPEGRVIYVRPARGPLERFVLESGRLVRDGAPVHWYPVVRRTWRGVPGSQMWLAAAGLYGGELRVRIDGREAPVIGMANAELWLQIPWELQADTEAELEVERDGVVTSRSRIALTSPMVEFVGAESGQPVGYDDQWNPLDTVMVPIGRPVHFTVLGLGPAERWMATGEASPADPLVRVPGVECRGGNVLNPAGPEMSVHYAGLIPNEIGLYRISVIVPGLVNNGTGFEFACRVGGSKWSRMIVSPYASTAQTSARTPRKVPRGLQSFLGRPETSPAVAGVRTVFRD